MNWVIDNNNNNNNNTTVWIRRRICKSKGIPVYSIQSIARSHRKNRIKTPTEPCMGTKAYRVSQLEDKWYVPKAPADFHEGVVDHRRRRVNHKSRIECNHISGSNSINFGSKKVTSVLSPCATHASSPLCWTLCDLPERNESELTSILYQSQSLTRTSKHMELHCFVPESTNKSSCWWQYCWT